MRKLYIIKVIPFLMAMALAAVLPSAGVFAQTAERIEVRGIVKDNSGTALIGATVVAADDPSRGTSTGVDGTFAIQVAPGTELKVSYLGYTDRTVAVGNRTYIEVILDEDTSVIEDVVVIGYGTVAKKDLTGSIQSITGTELARTLNPDITESLNGRIGGVLVNKSSNRPGASMTMEIRGVGSINTSNEPLYVIDGVPSSSGMRHLNANDIESVDILKDASSAAIYGSQGANGVVIITTKGATKREGFSLDYNGSVGIKVPTRIPDMIGNMGDGMEYVNYRIDLWTKKYGQASLGRPDFLTQDEKVRIRDGEYYDWLRELSDPSVITSHSLNGAGGSENTSYSLGLSYMQDNGFIGKEKYTRYTGNVGLEHRISKKFTLGVSSYLSMNETDHGSQDALLNAYLLPPIVSPYDSDGDYLFYCQPTSSKYNPFIQIENNIKQSEQFYANANAFVDYKPIEGLSIKSQLSFQYDTNLTGEWIGTMTQQKNGVNPPGANRAESQNLYLVWDNIATYQKTFNGKHKIHIIGLYSMTQQEHKSSYMAGEGLPYESLWHAIGTADEILDVSSSYWAKSMISAMARANYTYDERYLLTLTARYDGTSILKGSRRWGLLPSVAVGWQIANEAFMSNVQWVNSLKLRLSWGRTGNNNFPYNITSSSLEHNRYYFEGKGENGFGLSSLKGNRNLKWEMLSEWNAGLDFGLFGGRLSGTVDVYSRKNTDLIMKRSVGRVNGFTEIWENIATTSNKGIEIGINSINVRTRDFVWRTSVTFSLNRDNITDLYGDKKDDLGNRLFIGESIRSYYDLKQIGIWQEHEAEEAAKYSAKPGHIKVWDRDGNGSIDESDFVILGSRSPDWTAGMTNTFVWRNFDFSFNIYARIGGVYSDDFQYMFTGWDNEHWNKLNVKYWTPENKNNRWPAVAAQSYHTQVLGQVDGTFVKVQNITLGYSLSEAAAKKIGAREMRAYVSVQNPFTFTSYVGSDPEVIGENVYTQMSLYPMTFSVGLSLKF